MWVPEGENAKIPVAIKELHASQATSETKELLAEARVMASVCHPCCIRILAICLSDFPSLITQLMPLGCLLQYLHNNHDKIGSQTLLNWCTQIAKVTELIISPSIVMTMMMTMTMIVG